jgi:simple sugar transport system substrate-binding protein
MKVFRKLISSIMILSLPVFSGGCADRTDSGTPVVFEEETESEKEQITIGFSQLGAESDWRSANTDSMLSSFTDEYGYSLIYENGQQKQSYQITELRSFIQQEVDYILLAPVTESGWDGVLEEAAEAEIPVILVDRRVDADKSLYSCWLGSDFELESRKLCEWVDAYTRARGMEPSDLNIIHIQGTMGSTAQMGRSRGLANAVREKGWNILGQMSGDFTETKGREVMTAYLKRFDNINVVYCENDNEAIGAIQAIESAGRTAGPDIDKGDILVVSFDGVTEDILSVAASGKIAAIAECNPQHGPKVRALIEALEAGESVEKFNYVDERIFSALPEVTEVTVDGVVYPIERIE